VDLSIGGGPDGYVSLRPFTLAERNRYSTANVQTWIGVTNLRYRLSANKLWFTPSPQTGQQIRIWYVPRLKALVDPVTLTLAQQPVADDLLIVGSSSVDLYAQIGAAPALTAENVATAINALGLDVTAEATGTTITLTGTSTTPIGLSLYNGTTIGVTTRFQLSTDSVEGDSITADGVSGWLEYVITDAAIKAGQKEESDTTTLQFQKAALIKRIEAAAENRDAGSPATIADVQWTNGTWPFGNGFGGGGGIP
jgi:hypothetical protein